MSREHKQSMGVTLNEALILPPGKIEAVVRDLGRSGYGIVRLLMRNTNFGHTQPQVVNAVARAVEEGHRHSMRIVLDCEPHAFPVAYEMGKRFPEAMGRRLVCAKTEVVGGRFEFHIPNPQAVAGRSEFLGIEGAWLRNGGSLEKLGDLQFRLDGEREMYDTGFSVRENFYVEGRPTEHRMYTHLRGKLESRGELIIYALFSDKLRVDFWSDGCRRYFNELLECYRGIPLDGVGWDEPATDGDWESYLYGPAFVDAFERRNGYRLEDRLWLLDEPGATAESVVVRLDYYKTLNEGVCEAQRCFHQKAKEVFGPDLIFGTHHTWQGEGGIRDYRAGAVDYFQLNENMDAGYTDCCWWDFDSVCYAYTLASSLGRLTSSGLAEVNSWHWKPTNSLTEYHSRLMVLMNVDWFNIFYGESSETCLYPAHYTWTTAVKCMRRNQEFLQRIGKARPVADIAILHGWETVAALNRPEVAGAHKTFCLNTARLLMDRNIAFDWIDSDLLARSVVRKGLLETPLESYRMLVLPYASVLPRQAWNRCAEFARAGGKIIFSGPPPAMDSEGSSLELEFAKLLDISPLPLQDYLDGIASSCRLSPMRPQRLDVSYPLRGDYARIYISSEGEPHGIQNLAGNVHYITDLDPRERLIPLIEGSIRPEVHCFSDSMLWRLYRDGERSILILMAHSERTLRGLVRFGDYELELTGGTLALFEFGPGGFFAMGDAVYSRSACRENGKSSADCETLQYTS